MPNRVSASVEIADPTGCSAEPCPKRPVAGRCWGGGFIWRGPVPTPPPSTMLGPGMAPKARGGGGASLVARKFDGGKEAAG